MTETVGDLGSLRPDFVAFGVYFCSSIDQFGEFPFGIVDPITDGAGRTWRLVSTELVTWMAGTIGKAFESDTVNDHELGVAILKFYRVRERLEQEIAAADGLQAGGQHSPGARGAATAAA